MMPVIRIPDATFKRLEAQARGFDTPAKVIERLLDLNDDHEAAEAGRRVITERREQGPDAFSKGKSFPAEAPPDLGHTRVVSASFAGHQADNWNDLVAVAHSVALQQLKSVDALRKASLSNVAGGRREDSGFHYSADGDFSIQNVDANLAWRNALHLARQLGLPLEAVFQWRHKEGAAHPGVTGALSWRPK